MALISLQWLGLLSLYKVVVLLLLIFCLMYSPLFVGVLSLSLVLLCITLCPFYSFFNHLEEEVKAGLFDVVVLQMYCYYKCSVALSQGAVVWSAVCDCGIS